MDESYLERTLAPYQAEVTNLRYFFKEKRTISQFQDWLWRRMPKLTVVTLKVPPHTPRVGRWGGNDILDRAVLYTDLLTLLVHRGDIVRERLPHTTTYVTKALDTSRRPSYKEESPF